MEKEYIHKYSDVVYNISKGGGCGSNPFSIFKLNGETLSSKEIADMSIEEITSHDITNRVNTHGWDLERAMTQPKQQKNTLYNYNGCNYNINELYNIRINKDLTKHTIQSRLSKGWEVERAISQPDNIKIQPVGVGEKLYLYNDKYYNSYELYMMRKCKKITQHQIVNRINQCGWSVEDAITKPPTKKYRKFYYKNNYYTTRELSDLSPIDNLSPSIILDRIKSGWDIDKAVETPINKYKHDNQKPSL